jgi:hypothetical protein
MLAVPYLAYSASPVTDGLVGYWNFDEGSGVAAIDRSGNGNNGTIVNATFTEDTPVQISSLFALDFNNTSGVAYSYVTIPTDPVLEPNSSLTLSVWVKTDSTEDRIRVIISKAYGSFGDESYMLYYDGIDYVRFALSSIGSIAMAQPTINEWHYIVATYNGSVMRMYLDGVEQVNGTVTGSLGYTDNPVLIGADISTGVIPDKGWDGEIDDVLIYDRALSFPEIQVIIDVLPPAVGTPILNPLREGIQPTQNVTVSVSVTDFESGVKSVTLIYSVDNGTTWTNPESMDFNNVTNLYEGVIPGQPMGTEVIFKITASDNAANSITMDGASSDYAYIVIPEFPTVLMFPMFTIATILAIAAFRKRHTTPGC